jgi:hypothetical protein
MGGGEPPGNPPRWEESARQDTAPRATRERTRDHLGGSRASEYSPESQTVTTRDMRYLPYLLPWVRLLFLIRSITSTEWDQMTGRLVQPIFRRALEMRRQITRDGWWN